MKSRPIIFRRDSGRRTPRGPLFLGQKVLGELRILMRLASAGPNGAPHLPHEQSY
ncbi:MAG TPA: hypothetical protein VNH84_03150 [Candidatus Saccharimonadales bacterium]|nr:hypothetical protein [Candidatus Saccharimonadales bacterium]